MSDPRQLDPLDLEVFSAAWCPDCVRLERWLAEQRVPYRKVDIEAHPEAAELLERETGKRAIPFIRVQGRWVRGYHRELPSRFSPDLLISELMGE